MSLWQPRRPSPTFSDLGTKIGQPIEAPNRAAAERLAIAQHGRPIIVELLVRSQFVLKPELDL